ncbi:cytochrome P450 [Gyrodon lividus]|nr:cytochrome P450 [Gyrodon lividus]
MMWQWETKQVQGISTVRTGLSIESGRLEGLARFRRVRVAPGFVWQDYCSMAIVAYSWLFLIPALGLIVVRILESSRARGSLRLPPGPKGLPIVGNILDFPQGDEQRGEVLSRWAAEHGDVTHLNMLGTRMVILNTVKAVGDLLEKRSAIYSNRPHNAMSELMGLDWSFTMQSGKPHRERRALVQRYFVGQVKDWQFVQLDETFSLLRRLLVSPHDWFTHVRLYACAIVLRIGYGIKIQDPNNELLQITDKALELSSTGPYLVEFFSFLKYYPSWLPFGKFQKIAQEGRLAGEQMRDIPFSMVLSEMAAGTAAPSFVSTLLNELPSEEMPDSPSASMIRDTAGVMYGAATDTTRASVAIFFIAMVLYPEVQTRAQAEIESVIGRDRLPQFSDRSSLPYIDALVLEILRWNVVAPLGIPHLVTQDDEYLGFRIPKGSAVTGNTWAIMRDPVVFPNPHEFDPSRFLQDGSESAREVAAMVFGWGRRVQKKHGP